MARNSKDNMKAQSKTTGALVDEAIEAGKPDEYENVSEGSLRFVSFKAENYMRLGVVEFFPDRNCVEITGKNGAGKTSMLDAAWALITGSKVFRKMKDGPIRKGAKKATLTGILGDPDNPSGADLIVTRTITAKANTLKIHTVDGLKTYKSPQAVLDALHNRLTFDPTELAFLPEIKIVKELIALTGNEDAFDALDSEYAATFERRTDLNREKKTLDGAIAALPQEHGEVPSTIDTAQHMEALGKIDVILEDDDAAADRYERHDRDHVEQEDKLESLKAQIETCEKALSSLKENMKKSASAMLSEETRTKKEKEAQKIRDEIASASEINARASTHERREGLLTDAREFATNVQRCSDRLESIKSEKAALVESSTLPKGIAFDFDTSCVRYNGIPLGECSDSERILLTVPLVMAKHSTLRIMRVQYSNLLDSESMIKLKDLTYEHDYQLWLESVEEAGDVGVLIEDGHVAAIDGKPTT